MISSPVSSLQKFGFANTSKAKEALEVAHAGLQQAYAQIDSLEKSSASSKHDPELLAMIKKPGLTHIQFAETAKLPDPDDERIWSYQQQTYMASAPIEPNRFQSSGFPRKNSIVLQNANPFSMLVATNYTNGLDKFGFQTFVYISKEKAGRSPVMVKVMTPRTFSEEEQAKLKEEGKDASIEVHTFDLSKKEGLKAYQALKEKELFLPDIAIVKAGVNTKEGTLLDKIGKGLLSAAIFALLEKGLDKLFSKPKQTQNSASKESA